MNFLASNWSSAGRGPHRVRGAISLLVLVIATCVWASACGLPVESTPTSASSPAVMEYRSDDYGFSFRYPSTLLREVALPEGVFPEGEIPVVGLASDVTLDGTDQPICFFAVAVTKDPPKKKILNASKRGMREMGSYVTAMLMDANKEASNFSYDYAELGGLRGYVVKYVLSDFWESRWYHLYRDSGTIDVHASFPIAIDPGVPNAPDEAGLPRGKMKRVLSSFRTF